MPEQGTNNLLNASPATNPTTLNVPSFTFNDEPKDLADEEPEETDE